MAGEIIDRLDQRGGVAHGRQRLRHVADAGVFLPAERFCVRLYQPVEGTHPLEAFSRVVDRFVLAVRLVFEQPDRVGKLAFRNRPELVGEGFSGPQTVRHDTILRSNLRSPSPCWNIAGRR